MKPPTDFSACESEPLLLPAGVRDPQPPRFQHRTCAPRTPWTPREPLPSEKREEDRTESERVAGFKRDTKVKLKTVCLNLLTILLTVPPL